MTLKGDDAVLIREVTLAVDGERPPRPELTAGAAFYEKAEGEDNGR